jgi:transmembrane sensor
MIRRLTALFERRPTTAEGWLARMGRAEVSARDQADFLAWLEADDDRLTLYEDAKASRAALEPLRAELAPDMALLRWPRRRAAPGFAVISGLAAAAVVGAVLLVPMLRGGVEERLYEGGSHHIRDFTLSDGSRLTLDAGSAVRVAMADDARRIVLERGSAFFDVAHDAEHPFQVAVADRRIIVTGTRFVTTLAGEGAQVALLQGRVVVSTRDVAEKGAAQEGLVMTAGEQVAFRAGKTEVRKVRADVEAATAWRERRLVFRDTPLSAVIGAVARYSDVPLIAADPALDRMRVTAVVPLEGEGPLSERLAALLNVRMERTAKGHILVRAE